MKSKGEVPSRYRGILYLQNLDQSVAYATEADFYNYTSKRWIFNEAYEVSKRHVNFNIQGLFDVAVELAGNGATKCTRAMKYREGEHNKVFHLTMDNQAKVVVKLPNPNAGPAYYTTASEVATMDYLRNVLRVPVPKVLGWSPTPENAIGSEYIIMEIAEGTVLRDLWYKLDRESKNKIIQQLVDLQVLLTSRPFASHGSLFYRESIPEEIDCQSDVPGDNFKRFTVGPLVHPALWEDGRDLSDVHKGPWQDIETYGADLGQNELHWTLRNARPRMNYFRADDQPEQPSEMVQLLEKYFAVVPHITACAKDLDYLGAPVLSHADLNLSNIFVDPSTSVITSVIDWQGSSVSPLVLQAKIPRMVRHAEHLEPGLVVPERAEDYESLNTEGEQAVDAMHASALCQKYYEVRTAKCNPQLYSAIIHNARRKTPFIEPLQVVLGSWKNRELHKLRSSLIRLTEYWNELESDTAICPITFDEQDLIVHDKEIENIDHIQSMMEAFQEEGILPADGRVDPEDWEALQSVSIYQKERYLSLADNESERLIMEKTWPWQDWPERVK